MREENGVIREVLWKKDEVDEGDISNYLFKNKDIKNEEIPEISDIMLEIVLYQGVNDLLQVCDNNYDKIQKDVYALTRYNFLMKEYLNCRRFVLEELYKIKYTSDEIERNKRKLISEFIDACRRYANWADIEKDFGSLFDGERRKIADEIKARMWNQKRQRPQIPYYWLEKFIDSFGEEMTRNRKIIKLLQDTKKYNPNDHNNLLMMQLGLNDTEFEKYLEGVKERYIEKTEEAVNSIDMVSVNNGNNNNPYLNDDFTAQCENMRRYIKSSEKNYPEIYERYNEGVTGCFGFLQIEQLRYITLSNVFDVEDDKIKHFFCDEMKKPDDKIEEYKELKKQTKKFMEEISNKKENRSVKYEWSIVDERMKRYPYPNQLQNRSMDHSIPKEGETLGTIIESNCDPKYGNEIRVDFTCCERKILKDVPEELHGEFYMFSKFLPCSRCIPAIREFNADEDDRKIKVFYIDSDDDGKNVKIAEWKDIHDEKKEAEIEKNYKKKRKKMARCFTE